MDHGRDRSTRLGSHDSPLEIPPLAVSVAQAAALVGVSRARLYPLILSGEIPSFLVGRRRLVPVAHLKDWVAHCSRDDGMLS